MPLKLLNLDTSWDFQSQLLTSGLDLFAQCQDVDISDLTGDGVATHGNNRLLRMLNPWAQVVPAKETESQLEVIRTQLMRLDEKSAPYAILICLNWQELRDYIDALPDKQRLITDQRPKAETRRVRRRLFAAKQVAPASEDAETRDGAVNSIVKLTRGLWPIQDHNKQIWVSFFVWSNEQTSDAAQTYRFLEQLDDQLANNATLFFAHDIGGDETSKFTYMRTVLDILKDTPHPGVTGQSHSPTWEALLPSAHRGSGQPTKVFELSKLQHGQTYSESVRREIHGKIQNDRIDQLNTIDQAELLSEQIDGKLKALDDNFLSYVAPNPSDLNTSTTTIDGMDPEAKIDAFKRSPGKIDGQFDAVKWSADLEHAFKTYATYRLEPLKTLIHGLEKQARESGDKIGNLELKSGASQAWKTDADEQVRTVRANLASCAKDARANLDAAKKLTLYERQGQDGAAEFAVNLIGLSEWRKLRNALKELEKWNHRKIAVFWPCLLLVLSLVTIVLFQWGGIYHWGDHKGVKVESGDAWTLWWALSAGWGVGPFAERMLPVWKGFGVFLAVTFVLAGAVSIGLGLWVRREVSRSEASVSTSIEALKVLLKETVIKIVAYRAKSIGAGQYQLLLNKLNRAIENGFSHEVFKDLVTSPPENAERDEVAELLSQKFFAATTMAYDPARLAEAIDTTIGVALAEDNADAPLAGKLVYDTALRPLKCSFSAYDVTFQLSGVDMPEQHAGGTGN